PGPGVTAANLRSICVPPASLNLHSWPFPVNHMIFWGVFRICRRIDGLTGTAPGFVSCRKPERSVSKQVFHEAAPFCLKGFPADGLTGPSIPVGCVVLITFLAMQIGMHPCPVYTFVLLSRFMGSCPITFGFPP